MPTNPDEPVPNAPLRFPLNPEVPACAAVRYEGGGGIIFIFAGKRHGDCLRDATLAGYGKPVTQGFMTTRGRFVNRVDAKLLMERAGRESAAPDGYRGDHLFSEDLY